jgi:4-diphosphocytidyl-2-C-methyl-D-erythritol kinase
MPMPALPPLALVLVNPGISIATADVFRGLAGKVSAKIERPANAFASNDRLFGYLRTTRNDLEGPARVIAPEIGNALAALDGSGSRFSRMSGSGATCFGLFDSQDEAGRAAHAIAREHKNWWVQATRIVSAGEALPLVQ